MFRFSSFPLALPSFGIAAIAVLLLTPVIARRLGERGWSTALCLLSFTGLLAVTVTPARVAWSTMDVEPSTGNWIWALPAFGALTTVNWQSLNLVLFAIVGIGAGLLHRPVNRRWALGAVMALAALVEIIQYAVPALHRGQFNSATVLIGWMGAILGFTVITVLRRLITLGIGWWRRRAVGTSRGATSS